MKTCKTCEHWTPKYRGIGICKGEGMPNAQFFIVNNNDSSYLLTTHDFSCAGHREIASTDKTTL